MKRYLLRNAIAFDQMLNAISGGYPNETLSARAWRKGDLEGSVGWKTLRKVVDTLFFKQDEHCRLCYEYISNLSQTGDVYLRLPCEHCPESKYEEEIQIWQN